jgi:hypothetical protein
MTLHNGLRYHLVNADTGLVSDGTSEETSSWAASGVFGIADDMMDFGDGRAMDGGGMRVPGGR